MPEYTLEYQEGHGLRTEPNPDRFEADSDADALKRAIRMLKIKGRLTHNSFLRTGAKEVINPDGNVIFPN